MITVLMATYQGRQYLEQQLDTILAQTVPVKILISDDGSDDGTREMLDNYAVMPALRSSEPSSATATAR